MCKAELSMLCHLPQTAPPDRLPLRCTPISNPNLPCPFAGMKHMFDGYAMLCKLRFSQGRVWGAQKYAQSDAYK